MCPLVLTGDGEVEVPRKLGRERELGFGLVSDDCRIGIGCLIRDGFVGMAPGAGAIALRADGGTEVERPRRAR